jgi:hypothetical protein
MGYSKGNVILLNYIIFYFTAVCLQSKLKEGKINVLRDLLDKDKLGLTNVPHMAGMLPFYLEMGGRERRKRKQTSTHHQA